MSIPQMYERVNSTYAEVNSTAHHRLVVDNCSNAAERNTVIGIVHDRYIFCYICNIFRRKVFF